jgi:hypothetical protein
MPGFNLRQAQHESLKVTDVQPNHGWRHLWREIVRGTRMQPELCDYMCGHESKSGTGARYGKRKVPVLARQMALFPRFKVPALNKPRALQCPPDAGADRGRHCHQGGKATGARERGLGLICPSPLPDISRWQRTFELSSTTGSKVFDSRRPRAPLSPVAACNRLPAAYH